MLRILDRHLLKQFSINLFIALLSWIVIFLVINIVENVSRFIDRGATLGQFMMYYVYFIPYIISLTLPVCMLLASLFTLSTQAQHNEIVAQFSGTISLYRIVAPLFILAVFISIAAGFFNETIVPEANQRRLDIMRYEISRETREEEGSRSNVYIQDTERRKFVVKYYNGKTREARQISIQTFRGPELIERIDAKKMIWKQDHWLLQEGRIRRFEGTREILNTFSDSVFTDTRIKPENMLVIQKKPEEMSYTELDDFIAELQAIGADPKKWLVERHLKISMPLANFIVVLLGAPFASRKRRGGMALNFGISLLISFIYFIIIRTGQVFGHQGTLSPMVGAWLGNIIFLILGLYTLLRVRK